MVLKNLKMEPIKLLQKYYLPDSRAYSILLAHSLAVTNKALEVARKVPQFNPDMQFIEEAGMLHDVGIFLTSAPEIDCHGTMPYICHGYLGRELLEKEGLAKHALVCERHVGVGLSVEDIENQKLKLPKRNMQPVTIEEEIICFSDKFFSKKGDGGAVEKSSEEILAGIKKHNKDGVIKFKQWVIKFGG
jgi:uncharacterized protein